MAENEVVEENVAEEAPVAEETAAVEEKKESALTKEVKPVIAWACYAGTVAIAVALALIFWLGAA